MGRVTKAVIPAAGLGTRFLPATKAQPKEMLPVVDKPAIQYVVEEAVRGRHRRHPHHHRPRQAQPRGPLRPQLRARVPPAAEGQARASSPRCVELAELADIHYVRQGEPLGLGHAVSVARKHVGDNPFVVMLGDDIMDERLHRADRHDQGLRRATAASVIALMEVPPRGDLLLRLRRRPRTSQRRARARSPSIVEKPEPGGGAVEPRRHGSLRVHPGDLRRSSSDVEPGVGGEIQLTDAIALLLADQSGLRLRVHRGSLRHRQEDRLPAGHRRARPATRGPRPGVPRVPDRGRAPRGHRLSPRSSRTAGGRSGRRARVLGVRSRRAALA